MVAVWLIKGLWCLQLFIFTSAYSPDLNSQMWLVLAVNCAFCCSWNQTTLPPLQTLFHMESNAGSLSAITTFCVLLALGSTFPPGSQLTQQPPFTLGLQCLPPCLSGGLRASWGSGSGSMQVVCFGALSWCSVASGCQGPYSSGVQQPWRL